MCLYNTKVITIRTAVNKIYNITIQHPTKPNEGSFFYCFDLVFRKNKKVLVRKAEID